MASENGEQRLQKPDGKPIKDGPPLPMVPAGTIIPDKFICQGFCGKTKPLVAYYFDLDETGQPVGGVCRKCLGDSSKLAYEQEKARVTTEAIEGMITATKGNKINLPHVAVICSEIIGYSGGIQAIAEGMVEMIELSMQQAREGKRSPKIPLDALRGIFTMAKEAQQELREDVREYSDKELKAEHKRLIEEAAEIVITQDEQEYPKLEAPKHEPE